MVVEYDMVGRFTQRALVLIPFIPLALNYLLENFNFNLCNSDTLSLLAEAVELNNSALANIGQNKPDFKSNHKLRSP